MSFNSDLPWIAPEERELRLRLFQQLHQSPDEEAMTSVHMARRDHRWRICEHCGMAYIFHPLYVEFLSEFLASDPTDNRLCNGDVVHL